LRSTCKGCLANGPDGISGIVQKKIITFAVAKKHSFERLSAMEFIKDLERDLIQDKGIPTFKAGDNVTVYYRITEGSKSRTQPFRGDVIQRKGTGRTMTFTVRKISNGIGVERIFPLFSPNIEKIEVHKVGRVRRKRIFYLRELRGKSARIREKR
jgi:large subunit ribosomal protein L19